MDNRVSLLNQKANFEWYQVNMPFDYAPFTEVDSNKNCFKLCFEFAKLTFMSFASDNSGFQLHPTAVEPRSMKATGLPSNITFHGLLTTWTHYWAKLIFCILFQLSF